AAGQLRVGGGLPDAIRDRARRLRHPAPDPQVERPVVFGADQGASPDEAKVTSPDPPGSPDGRPRRSPTLEVVAELAGVSRATVSGVVKGSARAGGEAHAAVTRAIGGLGYVPNRAARTLVPRRTDTIVLIMHERTDTVFEDPFFANVLRGVNAALASTDLQLVLLHARGDQQRERALRYGCNGHVDGALLISMHGDDPMPDAIRAAEIPMVAMGRPPSGPRADYVDADNAGGGREAVRHLIATGRRCLATVAGPLDMSARLDRPHR